MKTLTAAVVKAATPDTPLIWDDKVRGLVLRTYGSGTKTFCFRYRLGGVAEQVKVGRWPDWSVDAARERAKELRRLVDMGRNPAGEKRERREAPTIEDLVRRYCTEHLPRKGAKNR